jgi:undecaprenyl-diphosphatase
LSGVFGLVGDVDRRVSDRLRASKPPRWLLAWMIGASRLGNGWAWLAAGPLLFAAGDEGHRLLAATALAAGSANAVLVLVKRAVRRDRPPEGPRALAAGARFRYDRFSFPSGHALNAFALAAVLAPAFPPLAPVLSVFAVAVAASRVVLRFHFLSDVVAGALIGAGIGGAAFGLVR